jgi:chemotaxis protein CheX
MLEDTLQVFIDGIKNYFAHTNEPEVKIGTPYLVDNNAPESADYTGIIGVSGPNKGCVYFTSPKILLKHLLLSIGESETHEENMVDLVGEVANTLSGYARRTFGKSFMISVPVVIEGVPSAIHLPRKLRSYVIPVTWKSYNASVVICLQPD